MNLFCCTRTIFDTNKLVLFRRGYFYQVNKRDSEFLLCYSIESDNLTVQNFTEKNLFRFFIDISEYRNDKINTILDVK